MKMPKIIHYRNKCIGCNICHEMLPDLWRISRQDGKATLVKSILKKDIYQLTVSENMKKINVTIADACPVKIIKVL